jgi:hypothetical protein
MLTGQKLTQPYLKIRRHEMDMTTSKSACSCAWCQDVEPWRSRFAQCIQTGWKRAREAVAQGIACDVPRVAGREL